MTTNANPAPEIALNDGATIPQLGFGVWQISQDRAAEVVGEALRAGYRHIDTAQLYGNEQGVGEALRRSGLPRDQVHITTKCRNDAHGRHSAIDVSNFHAPHLERLISETGVAPSVNQIELHPWLTQEPLVAANRRLGVQVEGWSPLANGRLLEEQRLRAIADAHGKTVAQIVIRWHLQLEYIVIPKSVTPARIAANFDVFDFELTLEQLQDIGALNRNLRTGQNPDDF